MKINWWTLAIQVVNVAVLVWLLAHFFWRPLAAMIDQRRDEANRTLDDAQAAREQARAALAEIGRTREGFAAEREEILEQAQAQAQRNAEAQLAQARREIDAQHAQAQAAQEKARNDAQAAWHEQATQLALDIATRLCAPLEGEAARALFLDRLACSLRALDADGRAALAQASTPLQVVSASPLDAQAQQQCRARIHAALGAQPELAFHSDAGLIAGIELHGPHAVLSNSWRADLQRIGQTLAQDGST